MDYPKEKGYHLPYYCEEHNIGYEKWPCPMCDSEFEEEAKEKAIFPKETEE